MPFPKPFNLPRTDQPTLNPMARKELHIPSRLVDVSTEHSFRRGPHRTRGLLQAHSGYS